MMSHMQVRGGTLSEMAGKPKKNSPMRLEGIQLEPAEGGVIARCSFHGYRDGEPQYKSRVKVFEDSEELGRFVAKAFRSYEEEDEDGGDEEY